MVMVIKIQSTGSLWRKGRHTDQKECRGTFGGDGNVRYDLGDGEVHRS